VGTQRLAALELDVRPQRERPYRRGGVRLPAQRELRLQPEGARRAREELPRDPGRFEATDVDERVRLELAGTRPGDADAGPAAGLGRRGLGERRPCRRADHRADRRRRETEDGGATNELAPVHLTGCVLVEERVLDGAGLTTPVVVEPGLRLAI